MYNFSKNLRLLKYNEFLNVFKKSKFSFSNAEAIIFGLYNFLDHPRLGISIPKKYIKYAYERNRIKRLIREYFRLNQYFLPKMDFVILVKNGLLNLTNKEVSINLELLWTKYQH